MFRGISRGRHLGLIAAVLLGAALPAAAADYPRSSGPEIFTYEELLRVGEVALDKPLSAKLHALTTTPFIHNDAYYAGVAPHRPTLDQLGPSLRVVHWNVARGMRLDAIIDAFTDRDAFLEHLSEVQQHINVTRLLADLDALQTADIIVINEADWGMRRSEYREVAGELAEALRMNWAFGVEFIEVDPISLGTEQFEEIEDLDDRQEMLAEIAVDSARLRALHGTAVLSRYPIAQAELVPFETIGYDWFQGELDRISLLETGKRKVAAAVFLEKVRREVRRGGRTCLYVNVDVPDLPGGRLTIAAPHLENRTKPSNRVEQMREVLVHLETVDTPIILAGDLNTTFSDTTPTSIKQEIYRTLGSSRFWATKGIKYVTGLGLVYDVLTGGVNLIKNYKDPTAQDVPIVAPNPEYELFKLLEEWRFDDGTVWDFRGDRDRAVAGQKGTLGNSNERDSKGFAQTYQVERTIGPTGRLKLDWILVKSYIENGRDSGQLYEFAPHFSRTMHEVNYALEERLSDHSPISVDLPFADPGKVKGGRKEKGGIWPF